MNTIDMVLDRWTNNRPRFAKGALIDESNCCCAQGDALLACGFSPKDLRHTSQDTADSEVARRLGISLFHSILLRKVNDSADGCPENVLRFTDDGLGKVLGPNWRSVVAFGQRLDAMAGDDWKKTDAARDAAWAAARDAAWDAAWAAARDAAWVAAWGAARDAAWVAAGDAAGELVGWSKLKTPPFFLPMFGLDAAWVEKQEERWR